jgi:hypothetical protein
MPEKNYRWAIRNLVNRIMGFCLKSTNDMRKTVIFYIDPKRKYPGFVDILKAIIGCYYIAKENGYQFKIYFEKPFLLSKFLEPADPINDWSLSEKQINRINKLPISVGLLNYHGIGKIPKLHKEIYQVRNFIGWNILQRNHIDNWCSLWNRLYNELFKPSNFLQSAINGLGVNENEYIAVHIRFVNALELSEPDYPQKPLGEKDKERLINSCIKKVKAIETRENINAIVFSDSNLFLKRSLDCNVSVLNGNVGHITYNHSDGVVLKMFLDLYAIARSKKVFSLRGTHLYASAFPLYGSVIGGKEFEIIELQ